MPLSTAPSSSFTMTLANTSDADLGAPHVKGTYVYVRPHRHTYGNYMYTVAQVDSSDIRCRCIGKIIPRDLSHVASGLYIMAVTRPWVTCRYYIIPLFRRRPTALYKPYKRKVKEREGSIIHSCSVRTGMKS